jgi:phenylalanyl-tRNA synthetase beta chain
LVREDLTWGEIKSSIRNKLIRSIELFDIYQGKNITPGKKSLAFRIVYQAIDRTLTDDEVNKIHREILATLKSKFNAQIRD